jgi:hypothetical protein
MTATTLRKDWLDLRSEGYGLAECIRTLAHLNPEATLAEFKQAIGTDAAAQTIYIQRRKGLAILAELDALY